MRGITSVAIGAALTLLSTGCSGSSASTPTSTHAVSTGSGATSTSPSTSAPAAAAVAATLAATPTMVHPLANAAYSKSAAIAAATGGEVALVLPAATGTTAVTATLRIPAGALAHDTRITLIAVDDVDSTDGLVDAPASWHGVEIAPSGLMFAPGHFPTLTFSGVDNAFLDSTLGWDSDGVASVAPARLNGDGSVTLATSHFSGYGGGAGAAVAPSGPMADTRNTIATMLGADQAAQRLGNQGPNDPADYIKVIDQLHRSYIVPLVKAAASQCGAGLDSAVREWLGVEQMAQILGGDGYDVEELSPVVHKMVDCARADCKAGEPTAGGRFFKAVRLGSLLGVFSSTEEVDLTNEAFDALKECTSWRLVSAASLEVSIGGYPLDEHFSATGTVRKDGETIIPMRVTTRNADTIPSKFLSMLAQGFGSAMGVAVPNDAVKCSISAFGPSAARVVAASATGTAGAVLPTITFGGLVAPATITCGDLHWDDPTYLAFLMPALMPGITIADLGFQHAFTEAEHDGFTWTYSATVDVPPMSGITGSESLVLQLSPVATLDPNPLAAPPTAGLHDWGTGLRAAMS